MTNNIKNLSQIPVAATTGPPAGPAPNADSQTPGDQVTLGQQQQPSRLTKLVISTMVDERLLTPDATGQPPISHLEPVFVEKSEVAKHDPTHVPKVVGGQFSQDGGDLLVVPVPPHTNTSKFIAVPIEVPNELLEPTGEQHPDGTPKRPIDDFNAQLTPHDAVIKRPSDYKADLEEAYEGGKNDALPLGHTSKVANSKTGTIIEMGGGLFSKIGSLTSGFGNMTLAGWNSWMGLATAGTVAGIGGAIGVLGALDQLKTQANEKGRLVYLKQNYEAGEARQRLLQAAPEAGPRYLEALKTQFQADHALLEPSAELKQYDAAIEKGDKKLAKDKLNDGEKETLAALKQEREALKARVEQLQAKQAEAQKGVEAVRGQLPTEQVAKFDAAREALAPNLQHYEAQRGEGLSLPQAHLKALSAEGVGAVPMQTPQGIRNVPLDVQIDAADSQMKMAGVSAAASALGMTCGILVTVGVGCPPLLAAAAAILPFAGIAIMVAKPVAMLGKMLWNKWFNKDSTPTPDKAVTGAKAKPEGPKETAAWEKSMAVRADLLKTDKTSAEGYFSSLQKLEEARVAVLTAPNPEEAGKRRAAHQQVALELGKYEQALEKSAPGKVAAFKDSLAGLNDCWAERKATDDLGQQFNKDILAAGVVTRSAEQLGLSEAQTRRVMTTLLEAEYGHRESIAAVKGWQAENAASPEGRLSQVLIETSNAIRQGADPNKVVRPANEQQAPAPAPAPAPEQSQDPQQARAELEQRTFQLVQAAIQGNPKADADLTRLGEAAQQGDAQAAEQMEIAHQIFSEIATNTKATLTNATPEQKAEARQIADGMMKGDPAAQKTLGDFAQKAQAGDQAAHSMLQVVDALFLAGRLGIPTEEQPPAAQ